MCWGGVGCGGERAGGWSAAGAFLTGAHPSAPAWAHGAVVYPVVPARCRPKGPRAIAASVDGRYDGPPCDAGRMSVPQPPGGGRSCSWRRRKRRSPGARACVPDLPTVLVGWGSCLIPGQTWSNSAQTQPKSAQRWSIPGQPRLKLAQN